MFQLNAFNKTQRTLVFIMLTSLLQLLPGFASAKQAAIYPRQINLSGNIFHFSMPEDFSKDMPAADMVEQLDINDSKKFDDPEYGNLIRRWWDIKSPGWFGKEMGTVMMNISVRRVSNNKQMLLHKVPYDMMQRLDLMLILDEQYHLDYDAINKEMGSQNGVPQYYTSFATLLGTRILPGFRDYVFNQQKWTHQSIGGPRSDLIFILAIPVSNEVFLEASFTYTVNDGIPLREFRDAAFAKMAIIQESFKIEYKDGNPMAKIVGNDWLQQSTDEVLEQHRPQILKLFSTPNTNKKLLDKK